MLARIKFDISPLVTDMLDQLPADVWTSTKTTFEDPALAGGQFVAEIEKRLSAVGHSEKNISKRVFGSEKSPHRVQYAISKNKLVGNYTATDFLTTPTDMNRVAQIAVGNPPYNDGSKGRNPIYQLFLEKYATNPPDYLFKIIPSNWFSQPKNKLGRSVRSSLIKLGVYKIKMNSYSAFENAKVKTCTVFCRKGYTGEFTIINSYLVRDLKRLGLWDEVMVMDLKHFDGSLRPIDRVPPELKSLYATAFEVEPIWIVEAGSRRQKWIDQAQSLNIYMAGASGKKLDDTYKLAWVRGLKTTYYLRTMSATHVEKSTVTSGQLNSVSSGGQTSGMGASGPAAGAAAPSASRPTVSALEIAAAQARAQQIELSDSPATDIRFCGVDDPTCESCQ